MKNKLLITPLLFFLYFNVSAQNIAKIIPNPEPFKIFQIDKYAFQNKYEAINIGKVGESPIETIHQLPVLKIENFNDEMPILKPDKRGKYSLIIVDTEK